jgi:EAL domain-containing protein (putative c-di-GMP-specific phosphodiesterase class I)
MDPLDVLTYKENIIPYFQPIVGAEEQLIVGYEVLGRYKDPIGTIHSLGDFFHDETIPDEYRLEIDYYIQSLALTKFLEEGNKFLIFLNRNPNLLMKDRGEELLTQLLMFKEKGLDLNRIVIEISEHNFYGDIEGLCHLFSYFRTYGIQLAVDNVGREGSNLDRLRQLNPDILKVDLEMLKRSQTAQSYQVVLHTLSLLARKIGATLLYEGIEASFQFPRLLFFPS